MSGKVEWMREDGCYTARVDGNFVIMEDNGAWAIYDDRMMRLDAGISDGLEGAEREILSRAGDKSNPLTNDGGKKASVAESWVYDPADPTAHTVEMHEDVSKKTASKRTFLRKDESGKLAGITRERPHFDSSGKEGVFEDGVRWCETSLWYRQWDDGEMPSSPEDWGEDVTLCDDGSGTLAVIYADDQIAYFEGSDYMYPQGDAIDFSKALGDDDLAREVLVESSRYDENVNGETVDVAKFEERWIIPDVQPKDYF